MTIEELSARLELVERANRRLRAVGIMALVLAAATTAMAQITTPDKVIQAGSFEVVDCTGVIQAQFGMNMTGRGSGSPGAPQLRIFDKNRKSAELVLTGGALSILNDENCIDVQVQNFLKEGTGLIVCDGTGKVLVRAVKGETGSPEVLLTDRDGQLLFRAPSH
jgi:hypothetical protein